MGFYLIPVLFLFLVVYITFLRNNGKVIISPVLPASGLQVPVRSIARTGTMLLREHNNLFPKLVVYGDKIAFRILWTTEYPFTEIKEVKVSKFIFGLSGLQLSFNDNTNLFISTNLSNIKSLVEFLKGKNVKLAESAERLLSPVQ